MRLYLAGPLFSLAEKEFNLALAGELSALGYSVWLPQENEPRDRTAKAVFEKGVEGVDWADIVVANLDGSDPDSGTCWECGYAYKKKPVIVFRTDIRAADEPGLSPCNLMLWESADERLSLEHEDSISKVAELVHWAIGNVRDGGTTAKA